MPRITVLGAGAWGTALAIQAARAGCEAVLWARDGARAAEIDAARENARYLPGVDAARRRCGDRRCRRRVARRSAGAAGGSGAGAARRAWRRCPSSSAPMLLCCKGVEAGTLRLPLEVLAALRPGQPAGVLSGPNFAHEVARGLPAAAVVGGGGSGAARGRARAAGSPGFRLYAGEDPVGAEVGGAAKNVIAIAAGAVIGAGLGRECARRAGDARAGGIVAPGGGAGRAGGDGGGADRAGRPGADLRRAGQPEHVAGPGAGARGASGGRAGGPGRRDRGRGDGAGAGGAGGGGRRGIADLRRGGGSGRRADHGAARRWRGSWRAPCARSSAFAGQLARVSSVSCRLRTAAT